MTQDCVLALDIGTSSVRAIVFDSHGNIVAAPDGSAVDAQIKYAQHTTADGGVEVDADALLLMTVNCLANATIKLGDARTRLAAVGISCFWHSLVGVRADNRALTPLYSWADTRSSDRVPRLKHLFDPLSYHQTTGAELHPCFWPAKLLWLRQNQPDLFRATTRWLGFAEYLMLRVFGRCDSSLSMASGTGLFNQQTATWDLQILESLGIDAATLPGYCDFEPIVGMNDEFRGQLSGLNGVPWFPAVGDGACSNIGSGGCDDDVMVLNIGTSAAIRVVVPAPLGKPLDIQPGLFCYRVDGNHAIHGGAFANGGNIYAWLSELLDLKDNATFETEVANVPPDGHGLTVMPFWAGERSPGWRPNAHAAILGMNLHTSRADIVRASLEACAYSFEVVRSKLGQRFPQARQIVLSGGAAGNSPLLCQIVCDVFGLPLVTSKVAEASTRGAALLALQAAGIIKSWFDARAQCGQIFQPDDASHRAYLDGAERYLRYYEELAKLEFA